jgi:hypothetical protein
MTIPGRELGPTIGRPEIGRPELIDAAGMIWVHGNALQLGNASDLPVPPPFPELIREPRGTHTHGIANQESVLLVPVQIQRAENDAALKVWQVIVVFDATETEAITGVELWDGAMQIADSGPLNWFGLGAFLTIDRSAIFSPAPDIQFGLTVVIRARFSGAAEPQVTISAVGVGLARLRIVPRNVSPQVGSES